MSAIIKKGLIRVKEISNLGKCGRDWRVGSLNPGPSLENCEGKMTAAQRKRTYLCRAARRSRMHKCEEENNKSLHLGNKSDICYPGVISEFRVLGFGA